MFSGERSTFTLFTKLKVLRSAPITKLNMYAFSVVVLFVTKVPKVTKDDHVG